MFAPGVRNAVAKPAHFGVRAIVPCDALDYTLIDRNNAMAGEEGGKSQFSAVKTM